jgi:transposase
MDDVRLLLSDQAWDPIEAALRELKHPAGSPPLLSDRWFVEAVLYLARTGTPWRDLPKRFGAWDAVYNRFRRWENRGIWRGLFERLPGADLQTVKVLLIDSTSIRAHPHAAGAPRKRGAPRRRVLAAAAVGSPRNCTSPQRTNRRLLLSY